MFPSLLLALLPPTQGLLPSGDTQEMLDRRTTPVVRVVRAATPAVVYIQTGGTKVVGRDWFGRIFSQRFSGAGSGVMIRKEGFIITNYHVIRDAQEISVTFHPDTDQRTYKATVVSFEEAEDLALLKIQGDRPFSTIPLGRSDDLMPGETVIAIGNPYGQTISVSDGIISGLHRNVPIPQGDGRVLEFPDLIQTDASINPGNSGGPLLNINGELIGINSAMNVQAQNIGFAIPVDRVRSVLENQLLSPETAPAWLGFDIEPGDHLCVASVVPGSPAERAGLRPGDCIVSMAGEKVVNQDEYRAARVGLAPWRETELLIERKGKTRKVDMEPWDRDVGFLYEHLGVKVDPRPFARGVWLQVTAVRPGGPADSIGIQVGDLLDSLRPRVQGWRWPTFVETRENLANLVERLPAGTEIELEVLRDFDGNDVYSFRDEVLRGTIAVQ